MLLPKSRFPLMDTNSLLRMQSASTFLVTWSDLKKLIRTEEAVIGVLASTPRVSVFIYRVADNSFLRPQRQSKAFPLTIRFMVCIWASIYRKTRV